MKKGYRDFVTLFTYRIEDKVHILGVIEGREKAKEKMLIWMVSVMDSELTCFNQFIETLSKYQEQIANYFIQRNSSGFVEGFNNKVKVLKRRCDGLSSATRLFQRLVLDTMGMDWFAPGAAAF